MTWTFWAALVIVVLTIAALIKRYETRLVLLTAGFVMTLLAFDPMAAFKQFDKSMTNASLIIAICSSMGFAGVMSLTKCDLHLVSLLTKPLRTLGVLLLPCCMLVTGFISVAISSFAGLCAAVGPTMIILMVRSTRRSPQRPLRVRLFRGSCRRAPRTTSSSRSSPTCRSWTTSMRRLPARSVFSS